MKKLYWKFANFRYQAKSLWVQFQWAVIVFKMAMNSDDDTAFRNILKAYTVFNSPTAATLSEYQLWQCKASHIKTERTNGKITVTFFGKF